MIALALQLALMLALALQLAFGVSAAVSVDVSVSADFSVDVSGETSKPFNSFVLHPTDFILPSNCSADFIDSF